MSDDPAAVSRQDAAIPPTSRISVAWRLLGPVLLVLLVWLAGPRAIAGAWEGAHGGWLLAAAGLNAAILVVKTRRWQRLMRAQRIAYPFRRALRHYTIGSALGAWTPGRVGDFSKGVAVHRDTGTGLVRAMSSVLADRMLDAAALACVAAIGWIRWDAWSGAAAVALGAGAMTAFAILRWRADPRPRGEGVRDVGAPPAVSEDPAEGGRTKRGMHSSVRQAIDDLRRLGAEGWVSVILWTAAATLTTFFQAWCAARALGLSAGPADVAIAVSVASLASLLPVSVGGFGTREASVALVLSPLGVTMPQVIGFCLAHVAVTGGVLAIAGAAVWMTPAPAPGAMESKAAGAGNAPNRPEST